MRKRHPPEYFKGQAAPRHTQEEAWRLFMEGYESALSWAEIIVVDGQPRSLDQNEKICALSGVHKQFIFLHAPIGERERRARAKYEMGADKDEGALQLAMDRMKNDILTYHEVLIDLHLRQQQRQSIMYINTLHEDYHPNLLWAELVKLWQ